MPLQTIERKAAAVLNALDCPDSELSIVITDDPQIEILNRTYLNHEGPTNVISFPMQEGEFSDVTPGLLGDVVISADTARREADLGNMDFLERVDQLMIHGILHLLGYDHVNDPIEAEVMDQKAAELHALIKALPHAP